MKPRGTKTGALRDFLLKEMSEHKMPVGARLPSETKLMGQFRLSRSSVRQVLSELSIEGWVERQQGRGTFCAAGAGVRRRNQRTMLVGVWFNWPSGPLFGPIAQGIREELSYYGYHAVFENGGLQVGAEAAGVEVLLHKALDGFIVGPSSNPEDDHTPLAQLIEECVPMVLVDRALPGYCTDLVATANELGGGEMIKHLIDLGHRRIGFVGTAGLSTVEERLCGYRLTMRRHGLPVDQTWIQTGMEATQDSGRHAARVLLGLPAESRPTAIFGANDVIAETIGIVAREQGLNIPGDLSIVGFDDISPMDNKPAWLTTYAQPKLRIGQQAARLLMSRIQTPMPSNVTLLLEGSLIKRASTAPPR